MACRCEAMSWSSTPMTSIDSVGRSRRPRSSSTSGCERSNRSTTTSSRSSATWWSGDEQRAAWACRRTDVRPRRQATRHSWPADRTHVRRRSDRARRVPGRSSRHRRKRCRRTRARGSADLAARLRSARADRLTGVRVGVPRRHARGRHARLPVVAADGPLAGRGRCLGCGSSREPPGDARAAHGIGDPRRRRQ